MKNLLLLNLFFFNFVAANKDSSDAHSYHMFSWAYYNFCSKNFTTAENFFKKFFEKSELEKVDSPFIGYLTFLYETKNYDKFLAIYEQYKNSFDKNEQLQFAHAMVLRNTLKFEDSIKEFKELSLKFPHNQEIAYYAILASLTNLDFKNALQIIDNLFKANITTRSNYVFHLLSARCYIGLNDLKNGKLAIDKCVQLHPQSPQGWLMYGIIYKIAQEINQSIYGYKRLLDLVGSDKTVEQELFNLKIRQKAICQKSLDKAVELYNENKSEEALALLNKSFDENDFTVEDFNTAMILKIEILTSLKKETEALALIEKLILKQPENNIWYDTLNLMYHASQNKKDITKLIGNMAENQSKNLTTNLYAADIFLRTDTNKGIKYCYKCLNLIPTNGPKTVVAGTPEKDLRSKLIFQIASAYYKDKKFDALNKLLNEHLNSSEYAPLINLAAYYYATKGNNITLAQNLMNKIFNGKNEKIKTNPYFLDTQAHIWYKNKEYNKAVKSFEQLAALLPDDKIVTKHLNKAKTKLAQAK